MTKIKIALENAKLPFDVIGGTLFGSMAIDKSTLDSDIDLLIIGEGFNPKRHRRGDDIVLLKQCLPLAPLDILLFTPQEVFSNFKNHNPLFLDIAEDGVVLFDKNNFLETLINDTRNYIRLNGIKRLKGGWEFPVEHGIAAYLSNVSNKDFATSMIKDGERDFLIGKKLIDEGFYDKSVYHFQQSVEKCIKAVLITIGIFQKTHFVGQILRNSLNEKEISELWKEKLLKIASISDGIEPEVGLSRYPGIIDDNLWLPYEEYVQSDAEKAREKAEEVMLVAKEFLRYWFLDRKFKETDKEIEKTSKAVAALTGKWSKFVEGLIAPATERMFKERGIEVDKLYQRVKSHKNGESMEIDILAINGDYAVLIEAKSTLRIVDVDDHIKRLEKFKCFFPEYGNVKAVGAVGGIVIEESSDKYAYKKGLFVITEKGDCVEIMNDVKFKPEVW